MFTHWREFEVEGSRCLGPHGETTMYGFDAWALGGVGGVAALTYIAAGSKMKDNQRETSLRLTLPGTGNSLLGDVRVLGGAAAWMASRFTSGDTKKAMQTIAWASGLSVLVTEVIRMQLARRDTTVTRAALPIFPTAFSGTGAQSNKAYASQGAWAQR